MGVVDEWIKLTEETTGQKPKSETIQFVIGLDKIGQAFEVMGRNDAAAGYEAYTFDALVKWAEKQLPDDPQYSEFLAELMQIYYMDGYDGYTEGDEA